MKNIRFVPYSRQSRTVVVGFLLLLLSQGCGPDEECQFRSATGDDEAPKWTCPKIDGDLAGKAPEHARLRAIGEIESTELTAQKRIAKLKTMLKRSSTSSRASFVVLELHATGGGGVPTPIPVYEHLTLYCWPGISAGDAQTLSAMGFVSITAKHWQHIASWIRALTREDPQGRPPPPIRETVTVEFFDGKYWRSQSWSNMRDRFPIDRVVLSFYALLDCVNWHMGPEGLFGEGRFEVNPLMFEEVRQKEWLKIIEREKKSGVGKTAPQIPQ